MPSGMERMLVSGQPYFKQQGIDNVIVAQGRDHPFWEQMSNAGLEIHQSSSVRQLVEAPSIRGLLLDLDIDIIHIHTESGFGAASLIARSLGRQIAVFRTIHNIFPTDWRHGRTRRLQARVADRYVTKFIAPSLEVADNETNIGRHPDFIPNWVDDSFFSIERQLDQNPSIVVVGNSSPIKNHTLLLRSAMANGIAVYKHGTETAASTEEVTLLDELERRGILLHRGTGDPRPSLSKAWAYAMPSKHEGMPVAVLEAMAAGVPCILNDAPGLRWAKGMLGAVHLEDCQKSWDAAIEPKSLEALSELRPDLRAVGIDPSAERGAREYAELYRRHVQHSD